MKNLFSLSILLLAGIPCASPSFAGEEIANEGGYVHNLKVLSDKIDDVTTPENILKSFIRPGMTDAQRARGLWTAAVKYRHQAPPPNEFLACLAADDNVHDPVKLFNVYGYCMCCCGASIVEALNRLDGREARGRVLTGHSVAEVKYGGGWHMFDPSLIAFFPKPGGEEAASVDEISSAVRTWYAAHPEYRDNPGKLKELLRSDQWSGWKARGPALLARCPFYRLGFLPAGTHGWDNTMIEYDRECEECEYGYQIGHRALFSLQPGESFVRAAGNRGLHVDAELAAPPEEQSYLKYMLAARAPQDDLVYLKDFHPGYHGGLIANGYHRYTPDLAGGGLALGAEVYENLATGGGGSPALHLRVGGKPGVAIIPMTSPYVYLGARLKFRAVCKSAADRVTISISTNNGRTFTPIASSFGVRPEGPLDFSRHVLRRYAYWLKIELLSASKEGAGLDLFAVENDIQHAPRTLPWLGKGRNTITVAADGDTTQSTRSVACRITPVVQFYKSETSTSMGVVFDNLQVEDGSCWWKDGIGTLTVPVETPGDMTALRFSTQLRARGPGDRIRRWTSSPSRSNSQSPRRTARANCLRRLRGVPTM